MDPIVAASLVNKAAVDCLEELRLPIETHREVVRMLHKVFEALREQGCSPEAVGLLTDWWGIGARVPELKVIEGGKDAE